MVGCNEAGYNRDLVRRMVVGCQSLLFLFGRFWQLASQGTACAPHLRQKIAVAITMPNPSWSSIVMATAITMEDQLGFGLRRVYRSGVGHHHRGSVSVRASYHQRGRVIPLFLHSVFTR